MRNNKKRKEINEEGLIREGKAPDPIASTPEEVYRVCNREADNTSPEQREVMEKIKAAVARHAERASESEQQMRREIKEIVDAHPGLLGSLQAEAEEK